MSIVFGDSSAGDHAAVPVILCIKSQLFMLGRSLRNVKMGTV